METKKRNTGTENTRHCICINWVYCDYSSHYCIDEYRSKYSAYGFYRSGACLYSGAQPQGAVGRY